ncbi:MAG: DNA-binding response regulator [Chloroflexi bacterium B3_Chlor]|nr:MAG: DNA-binding response regulator [Chloroflexi bacterium B3_Chlor]
MTEGKIRAVLADDHALVRQGVRRFLEESGDITVVAEAGDGERALELVAEHQPDIAILDIRMPKMSGVDLARRIKAEHPQVRILVLTAYDDDPYVFALVQAGVDGYVLKTADSAQLIQAVRRIAEGEPALDATVARRLMERVRSGRVALKADGVVERPTDRELEVLRLAGKGLTNRAIGQELGISGRTVQGHLARVYSKLQVGSRTEAVLKAVREGWISMDDKVE